MQFENPCFSATFLKRPAYSSTWVSFKQLAVIYWAFVNTQGLFSKEIPHNILKSPLTSSLKTDLALTKALLIVILDSEALRAVTPFLSKTNQQTRFLQNSLWWLHLLHRNRKLIGWGCRLCVIDRTRLGVYEDQECLLWPWTHYPVTNCWQLREEITILASEGNSYALLKGIMKNKTADRWCSVAAKTQVFTWLNKSIIKISIIQVTITLVKWQYNRKLFTFKGLSCTCLT